MGANHNHAPTSHASENAAEPPPARNTGFPNGYYPTCGRSPWRCLSALRLERRMREGCIPALGKVEDRRAFSTFRCKQVSGNMPRHGGALHGTTVFVTYPTSCLGLERCASTSSWRHQGNPLPSPSALNELIVGVHRRGWLGWSTGGEKGWAINLGRMPVRSCGCGGCGD